MKVFLLTLGTIVACLSPLVHGNEAHTVVLVKFVKVLDAYSILQDAVPKVDQIVTVINIADNSLTLNPTAPGFVEVQNILAQVDTAPRQLIISTVVTAIEPNGKEKTLQLSSPTVLTSEGKTTFIQVAKDGGRTLKISVTVSPVDRDLAQ